MLQRIITGVVAIGVLIPFLSFSFISAILLTLPVFHRPFLKNDVYRTSAEYPKTGHSAGFHV